MSLQVWLPLLGDLENKGLNNVAVTAGGSATVNDNGKLGKCYQFGTSAGYIDIPKEAITSCTTECSVAFWVKINSWNANWATLFQAGITNLSWNDYYFGVLRNNNGSTLAFVLGDTTTSTQNNMQTSQLTTGVWYHMAFIYNNKNCKIYINGILDKEYTNNTIPAFSSTQRISLGCANTRSGYPTDSLMNDFRLYDHALSPLEVKELAQGLVLHYPLNKTAGTPTFVNTYPTFDTSSADGGWSHWTSSGTGTFSQNTDKQYIYDKSQTYSHCISYSADGTYKGYLCYQSPAFEGGFRSMQAIIKEENGSPITNSICFPTWNANQAGGATYEQWQIIEPLGNGFYRCVVNGFKQDGSNDLVGIYVKAGYKIYLSCFYIEDNVEECTYNCADLRTEISDVSGYGRNGTPLGTLALSSDTPRYDNALTFNGTNSAIRFKDNGIGNIFNDSWTLSFWIKSNSDLGTRSIYLGGYEQSPYINIEKSNTNKLRFVWNLVVDQRGTATLSDDVWYMITVVASSLSNVKCYINGELDLTITDTRAALTFPDSYLWYIGRDTRENTGLFFHGNMSDFRLYATALSEADIINLYKTSARIDNKFNIHTNELIESDSRELMACGVVTSAFTYRSADSPAINYNNDGELYYTAALTSNGSTYIKVNPDNSTYYYDFEVSVGNGNMFYIGFERWGATKTDYGNGNCMYALNVKPDTDLVKAHYQGSINLGALLNGTEPVDTISLRVLNGWSGSTSGGNMSATIHSLSLREVKTLQNTSINKNATILTDEIKEFQKAAVQENGMLQAVNFIEY